MKKILAVLILISFNLYSLTENEASFIEAAKNGDIKKVKELLALGADINIQDDNSWTALIYAAWAGHTETVKELIKAGANLNIKDNEGKTALDYAEGNGYNEIAKLLRSFKKKMKK
ncbi:ankyrin repeat domain-containing protein [uncultured Brachyspira sp.]|uniref:ankyrin repeat domain-containing protein n=1 Tax=uncultured Brachyspira sp. TaxID=221953 RepID=UPI002625BF12|nr:ankyrin repeat domain-containing protein [uncultured Brachyspira sp.]